MDSPGPVTRIIPGLRSADQRICDAAARLVRARNSRGRGRGRGRAASVSDLGRDWEDEAPAEIPD